MPACLWLWPPWVIKVTCCKITNSAPSEGSMCNMNPSPSQRQFKCVKENLHNEGKIMKQNLGRRVSISHLRSEGGTTQKKNAVFLPLFHGFESFVWKQIAHTHTQTDTRIESDPAHSAAAKVSPAQVEPKSARDWWSFSAKLVTHESWALCCGYVVLGRWDDGKIKQQVIGCFASLMIGWSWAL